MVFEINSAAFVESFVITRHSRARDDCLSNEPFSILTVL